MRLRALILLSTLALPAQAQVCTGIAGIAGAGDGTGQICHVNYVTVPGAGGTVDSVYSGYLLQPALPELEVTLDLEGLSSVGASRVTLVEVGFIEPLGPDHGGATLAVQAVGSPDTGWNLFWTTYAGTDHTDSGAVPSSFAYSATGALQLRIAPGKDWCHPELSVRPVNAEPIGKPATATLDLPNACAPLVLRLGIMGLLLAPYQVVAFDFPAYLVEP